MILISRTRDDVNMNIVMLTKIADFKIYFFRKIVLIDAAEREENIFYFFLVLFAAKRLKTHHAQKNNLFPTDNYLPSVLAHQITR